jgi:small conductance mechanosensitive channel
VKLVINRLRLILLKRHTDDEGLTDLEAHKRVITLMDIITGLLVVVIWAMFIMIFLTKIGINIAPILASAGIIGLAVGFGAQELVRDFISGFFMLLEDQIRVGDVAVINGTGGLVEKMELRTITLRDFSGVVHIFQNGKVDTLSNRTKGWSAMVFDIGVAYKENVDNVIELIKEVGEDIQKDPEFRDKILEPIEVFGLDEFGDSALVIKARFKTKPIEQWGVGREFRRRLKISFDKNKIEIPFPHTTVYWGEEIKPLQLKVEEGNIPLKKS